MSKKTAVVVGGGIAGLATSALLAKAGMNVKLFEARESLGGRAYLWVWLLQKSYKLLNVRYYPWHQKV